MKKKVISAFTAAVITASAVTANASELFASYLYNDAPVSDNSYYCIVNLDDPNKEGDEPLAVYEYAKQNGIDKFILTEDGMAVYEKLMSDHASVLQTMSTDLGREVASLYDYTSVYNGFSVILKASEYEKIKLDRNSFGVADIYCTQLCSEEISQTNPKASESLTSSDLTDKIRDQMGINSVEEKGDSTVIAIIDNEFDYEHEFLSTMPENTVGALTPEYVDGMSQFLSATGASGSGYYYNEKIPYKFNYGNATTDTKTKDPDSDTIHGTHVAGIAAGNGAAETDQTYDAKGAAPDAQLLLMSCNYMEHEVMAAYNDCAYLGADTINASYGSYMNQSVNSPYSLEAITNLKETGTMFCAASGNMGKVPYTGNDSLLNPDYSTAGTPDALLSSFSVGSAVNTVKEVYTMTAGGKDYEIASATNNIVVGLGGKTKEIAVVPGLGYPEDFEDIDVNGKIALIQRGIITFDEKAQNAKDNGAVGVIFYDNVTEDLFSVGCSALPAGLISKADGEKIIKSGETSVTINSEKKIISSLNTKMASSSTWDYTEELILKPDITAFGGNIISSFPGNKYTSLSGTSMAAPQITGMTALLKQYLKNNAEKYGIVNESDYSKIITNLLMSTAKPVYSSDGLAVASPRVQGNGLANVESAMKTPAYIYTDSEKDCFRPKLSLGDNIESKVGNMDFSASTFKFHIKNISDTPQTYTLSADIFRDDCTEATEDTESELAWNTAKMLNSKVTFKSSDMTEINQITIPAGEDAEILLDINFDDDELQYIEDHFENGTFIDGYVYLKNNNAPDLTLSFMGFYGSWSKAEIFEPFLYDLSKNVHASLLPSLMADSNYNTCGINNIAAMNEEEITEIPAYSPNGDNVMDKIVLRLGLKRKCRNINAVITKAGKAVYSEILPPDAGSMLFNEVEPAYFDYSINWNFEDAAEGEVYEIRLTAETPPALGEENNYIRDILTTEFTIDVTPPEIKECKKLVSDGKEYLLIRAADNHSLQGAVLLDDSNTDDPMLDYDYNEDGTSRENYMTLELPDNSKNCTAEVYDMAGNCVTLKPSDADDTYTLSFAENMFFSTKESTFSKKISLTDSSGNNVKFSLSTTPAKAFEKNITEVTMMINSVKFCTFPVTVGLAGDTDQSGKMDLYDVIKIAKYMLWKSNPKISYKDEFENFEGTLEAYLADYDTSGTIDLYDAIKISKALLKAKK